MKRLILLLICALYVTTAAQAQISFYGEWCRKGSGEKTIMIFDMKEKKAYVMNEARKTCMVMEEIDGKECAHYYVKSESIYKDGGKDGAGYHEWIYSPMKVSNYNGCIAHDNTVYVMDRTIVLRRVKMGPQPAHLFQVPEGYQMTVMPAGGLLEMMTGKSCEENTQKVDETRDAIQKSNEQIKEQLKEVNDKSKSDEERMKALLEMLGGQKKK